MSAAAAGKPAPTSSSICTPIPLSQLRDGDRARLHTAQLCCEDCDLLNAMGMTDRCEIRVCRVGEPCIVQVNSTRLGLGRDLARKIMVEVMDA
jgi:Fe2+ transport system protein FeoA